MIKVLFLIFALSSPAIAHEVDVAAQIRSLFIEQLGPDLDPVQEDLVAHLSHEAMHRKPLTQKAAHEQLQDLMEQQLQWRTTRNNYVRKIEALEKNTDQAYRGKTQAELMQTRAQLARLEHHLGINAQEAFLVPFLAQIDKPGSSELEPRERKFIGTIIPSLIAGGFSLHLLAAGYATSNWREAALGVAIAFSAALFSRKAVKDGLFLKSNAEHYSTVVDHKRVLLRRLLQHCEGLLVRKRIAEDPPAEADPLYEEEVQVAQERMVIR